VRLNKKMLVTPRLSTTVVLHSYKMKLDTDKVLRNTPLENGIIKIEKRGIMRRGESKRDRIKRRNPKAVTTSGFGHNSVTIVVMNSGNGELPEKEITIKIFHNGVFHMTGVLDPRYETSTLQTLKATLLPDSILEGGWDEHIERRVLLMNYSTAFTNTLNISRVALQRYFQEKGIQAEFEPDVSPCVKVVFPQRWTACIFRTGKINLTALKSHEDCTEFLKILEPHFEAYSKTITITPSQTC
jgi:TATA-box binding protein (TBP) (component of TFIID and TFIIIB)